MEIEPQNPLAGLLRLLQPAVPLLKRSMQHDLGAAAKKP